MFLKYRVTCNIPRNTQTHTQQQQHSAYPHSIIWIRLFVPMFRSFLFPFLFSRMLDVLVNLFAIDENALVSQQCVNNSAHSILIDKSIHVLRQSDKMSTHLKLLQSIHDKATHLFSLSMKMLYLQFYALRGHIEVQPIALKKTERQKRVQIELVLILTNFRRYIFILLGEILNLSFFNRICVPNKLNQYFIITNDDDDKVKYILNSKTCNTIQMYQIN